MRLRRTNMSLRLSQSSRGANQTFAHCLTYAHTHYHHASHIPIHIYISMLCLVILPGVGSRLPHVILRQTLITRSYEHDANKSPFNSYYRLQIRRVPSNPLPHNKIQTTLPPPEHKTTCLYDLYLALRLLVP